MVCENGSNRFSTVTISATIVNPGNGGAYGYRLDPNDSYQSSPDFEIVDNGADQTITIYAIDSNGCEDDITITVFAPSDVETNVSTVSELTCANDERVQIDVIGTTNFTVITSGPSGTTVANVNQPSGTTAFVDLPDAGDYLFEIQDNSPNGCSYPMPVYTVVAPVIPTVAIAEESPVICFGESNGALTIEITDYAGTRYSYSAHLLDNSGNRVLPAEASGSFDTSVANPEIISGLPGGNYIVDIVSLDDPECPATSNVATVRAPNGVLVPSAVEIGNVSCADNAGKIEANLSGGWDTAPYEYRLLLDADNDTTYETEVAAWGVSNEFENLSSGDYRVEYRDVEGCETNFDVTLNEILPIQAGIREPQGLLCPGTNNAVLEAFDPTTGDIFTAIPGATGGVAGAGYIYQLIYYVETDPASDPNTLTENSRSGLQDTPTFIGTDGFGYISQGWYAIEVSSSFGCLGVTEPYHVNPPPAVVPNLVQVLAPGCGGLGQMRLSVTNPEAGFDYEFRALSISTIPEHPITGPISTIDFTPFEDDLGNPTTSILLDGTDGFYQFEVRKITALNQCSAINSNGISLIPGAPIQLNIEQIDDISCSSEIDGRIETSTVGGIGFNTYALYIGDPADAFNPSASATLIDSNDFGTFENLDASADYYIAVTSGLSCQDIIRVDPLIRPEPIIFEANATPITCSGESDGTITVEVTSGGEGLLQFAIGPNFNEFFSDPDNPTTYTFEDLEGDTNGREYDILIQDSQGCSELSYSTCI